MNEELNPCPFCGGEAELYDYEGSSDIYDKDTLGYVDTEYFTRYGVGCQFCGCIIAEKKSEQDAIGSMEQEGVMSEFKILICTIDDESCTTKKSCKDCEKYKLTKALHEFLTADKE